MKLLFADFPTKALDEELKALMKNSILEINNLLVIPMKILEFTFEDKGVDTTIGIEVEDCADEREWMGFIHAFHAGAKNQLAIATYEIKKRLNKTV